MIWLIVGLEMGEKLAWARFPFSPGSGIMNLTQTKDVAMMIRNFQDFCNELVAAGFSMGSGNPGGAYSVIPFDWSETPPEGCPVRWHTGDPETDPWQWRIRALNERTDIAYAKVFFGRSGYIAREWYPYFLAVRREGSQIEDDYADGLISRMAMRVYGAIKAHGALAVHDVKAEIGFEKGEQSQFERALVELQMRMYITMCGEAPKIALTGGAMGWASMVYCAADGFFEGAFEQSLNIGRKAAAEAIEARLYALNPQADAKKVNKFING